MKFVLFCPDLSYYRRLFGQAAVSVDLYYKFGIGLDTTSKFKSFLYKVHRRLGGPCLNVWYKDFTPDFEYEEGEDICFVFTSMLHSLIKDSYYDYLKRHYNAKLVLLLTDKVKLYANEGMDLIRLKKKMDIICTFNKEDAIEYQLDVHPVFIFKYKDLIIKPLAERKTDVLFVGRDKGRADIIREVYKKCIEAGLKCDFYIIGETALHDDGMYFVSEMSYSSIEKKIRDSRAILNIIQPGASGVTVRDSEAYNYGCYLITNNKVKELKDFLEDRQIIYIDTLDFSDRIRNIRNDQGVFLRKDTHYSFDIFFYWLEEKLKRSSSK